jgi:hypothetical protein
MITCKKCHKKLCIKHRHEKEHECLLKEKDNDVEEIDQKTFNKELGQLHKQKVLEKVIFYIY